MFTIYFRLFIMSKKRKIKLLEEKTMNISRITPDVSIINKNEI